MHTIIHAKHSMHAHKTKQYFRQLQGILTSICSASVRRPCFNVVHFNNIVVTLLYNECGRTASIFYCTSRSRNSYSVLRINVSRCTVDLLNFVLMVCMNYLTIPSYGMQVYQHPRHITWSNTTHWVQGECIMIPVSCCIRSFSCANCCCSSSLSSSCFFSCCANCCCSSFLSRSCFFF